MPVIEREPCYIYNMREYQEHSLILEALSLNLGAIAILARGAKRPDSPLKGLFQPFTPLLLSLQLGQKGDLYYLKDYEYCPGGYHFVIPESFCAFYLNELLHLLYHGKESDKLLFGHYIATLEAIEHKDKIEYHLRSFELHLLKSLGYGISPLDEFGAPVQADKRYRFCFGVGFVEVNPDLMGQVMRAQTAPRSKSTSAERPAERPSESADDGLLFAKSKIRGPKLADTRTSASSSPAWVQRVLSQGVSSSDLKRYYEYNGEFLGPILTGAEIQDIVSLQFTDPNSLHIAKTLTSSVIDRLTGGVELNSRKLYREYLHLCKQKAQAAAAAPTAQQAPTMQTAPAPAQPVASKAAAQGASSVPEVSAEPEVVPKSAPSLETFAAPEEQPSPVSNGKSAASEESSDYETELGAVPSLETNAVLEEKPTPVSKAKDAPKAKVSTKSAKSEVAPAAASSLETNAAPISKAKRATQVKASAKSAKSEAAPAAASSLETNVVPEDKPVPVSKGKRSTKPASKPSAPKVTLASVLSLKPNAVPAAELEGAGAELVLTPQVVAPEAMASASAAAPVKAAKAGKKLTRAQLRAREKAAAAARAQAEQERLAASPYDESMLMLLDASLHRRPRRKKGAAS